MVVRSTSHLYTFGKRSRDVLKLKEVEWDAFKIVGHHTTDSAKAQGRISSLVCATADGGATFKVPWRPAAIAGQPPPGVGAWAVLRFALVEAS